MGQIGGGRGAAWASLYIYFLSAQSCRPISSVQFSSFSKFRSLTDLKLLIVSGKIFCPLQRERKRAKRNCSLKVHLPEIFWLLFLATSNLYCSKKKAFEWFQFYSWMLQYRRWFSWCEVKLPPKWVNLSDSLWTDSTISETLCQLGQHRMTEILNISTNS